MRHFLHHALCLLALTINSPAIAASGLRSTGVPEGFSKLAGPRETFVDVYFGGRKVAEALAVTRPGFLKFKSPADVLSKLSGVSASPELASALQGELATNGQALCLQSNAGECGILKPEIAGIIYDEDHFRVDVFINPKFLPTLPVGARGYLPLPSASLSLTDAIGVNVSGTFGGSSTYNLQNRTIVGFENARIRANTSLASDLGLVVDDLVGEVDRKNLRYSAGLFWTPGNEFTGQRRIVGAGVGTQFDTWANQEELRGTPLILFLSQPSRVELIVDGRLISSRSYGAGNVELDTAGLSEGSYSVLLRIREANGNLREERRFFVKSAQIAPRGHPIFYAYGGVVANTKRHQAISLSRTFYYQAGTAWRLTNNFALDAALLGTERKAIAQVGGWFIKGPARLRAAGLVSSTGDWGGLLQVSSAGHGPLSLSFDLRRIWSHDDKPLIPLALYTSNFDLGPATGVQLASGSYTQATASVGLRLGSGFLSLVGSYRKDRHLPADYVIGPSLNLPVITKNRFQIVFQASAERTRTQKAAFAGLRVFFNQGHLSMLGSAGEAYQSERGEGSTSRAVGSLSAQYSYETANRTLINAEADVDRNITSSTVHGGGTIDSRFGNFRADVLHDLEGRGGTQYDVAFQSGFGLGAHGAAWSGRDLEQSAMIISLAGDAKDASFNVLVDDALKGHVSVGRHLSIFVPGYRTYKVRLVPTSSIAVDYDSAERKVTLYPGNVQSMSWRAESFFTVFGQAISPKGDVISDALVQTPKGVAQTDGNGYFQVDVRRGDAMTFARAEGPSCKARIGDVIVKDDFASIGKVVCQ